MLTTADTKQFLFRSKLGLSRIEVSRIVECIEAKSKRITDRTSFKPDAFLVKTRRPVRNLLPSPKLRLVEIAEIDCDLSVAELQKSYQELLRVSVSLSKSGKI